jgi:endonuclease YncB( thermonuclease family)
MRRVAAVLVVLILSATSLVVRSPADGLARHAGNHYLSETYGFRVNWDDRLWFVVQQDVDQGWDEIDLSDGITYVFFAGGSGYGGEVQPCLDDTVQTLRRSHAIGNLSPLTGNDGRLVRGGTSDRAFAAYRYTYSFADGSTLDFVRYAECRTLVTGDSVVTIDVVMPAQAYDEEFPLAQDLIAGLSLPSPGEPGPVFVSEGWRIAVAGVARGSRLRTAGLDPVTGKDWLLVVVDATNWGSSDDRLSVDDFGLLVAAPETSARLASSATISAAKALGTAPVAANRAIAIAADRTRRLTLAFQIPGEATGLTLTRAGSALPLGERLVPDKRLHELPPVVGPPFRREARVEKVLDDNLLRITFLSDDSQTTLRLTGIDAPSEHDCYGRQTRDELDRLVGETVRIELETGSSAGAASAGYLWLETSNGAPVLVNQQLVAAGFAGVRADETDGRFGAWLAASAQEAQTARAGLWGACAGVGSGTTATPAAPSPAAG